LSKTIFDGEGGLTMVNENNILKDLKRLNVDVSKLKETFSQFGGTRDIVQYSNDEYTFSLAKTIKPKIRCFGVTNRTEDMEYIFFADYDHVYKSLMLKNLDFLIKEFPKNFDNFYIVKTGKEEVLENGEISGSYHVINFVKHRKRNIIKFLDFCDVDPAFIKIPQKTEHKTHVLRVSEKYFEFNNKLIKDAPEFLHVYPNEPLMSGKKCSKAHYDFFQNFWGHKTQLSHEFDNLTKIEFHSYLTPQKLSDKKKFCPSCLHDGITFTGVDNFVSCNKCGNTWGVSNE
jgi:ribosomal protein S27AE